MKLEAKVATPPRKKSPRAPSISLTDAVARAQAIYEKERRHAAPVDVVAQAIGYKSANNGAAMTAIASLRYFGLLERPREGFIAVTKDVEDYHYAPSPDLQAQLLQKWLTTPPLFADLLDRYATGLPSEKTLRYELIQKGFNASAAESVLTAFIRSVEHAKYFDRLQAESTGPLRLEGSEVVVAPSLLNGSSEAPAGERSVTEEAEVGINQEQPVSSSTQATHDRIPVRLPGGRRAWLEIPTPFFAADKIRLKAQIDLVLTEDEEGVEAD